MRLKSVDQSPPTLVQNGVTTFIGRRSFHRRNPMPVPFDEPPCKSRPLITRSVHPPSQSTISSGSSAGQGRKPAPEVAIARYREDNNVLASNWLRTKPVPASSSHLSPPPSMFPAVSSSRGRFQENQPETSHFLGIVVTDEQLQDGLPKGHPYRNHIRVVAALRLYVLYWQSRLCTILEIW